MTPHKQTIGKLVKVRKRKQWRERINICHKTNLKRLNVMEIAVVLINMVCWISTPNNVVIFSVGETGWCKIWILSAKIKSKRQAGPWADLEGFQEQVSLSSLSRPLSEKLCEDLEGFLLQDSLKRSGLLWIWTRTEPV